MINKGITKFIGKNREKIVAILYVLFFMYSCLMIWEVFLGPYRSYGSIRRYNFHPFKTVLGFLLNGTRHGFHAVFINIAANIITFIPLGFFITLLLKKPCRFITSLIYCLLIILCIEIGQFILNVGVLDIDDIILNAVGCILGYVVYKRLKNKVDFCI